MDLNNSFNQSRFRQYADYLKSQGLSDSSISRKLSSLSTFQKYLIKKKLISDSPAPVPLASSSISPEIPKSTPPFYKYLFISLLILLFAGLGYGLYTQTILKATKNLAYSTSTTPVRAGRVISFQGRLTDSSGNPITSSTNVLFELYTAGVGGTQLYTSSVGNSQTVVPDENGIFSVVIGRTHGTEIPSNVFSENPDVWLQIISAGETMTPRQEIATVGYAMNSETLQGLPPSASGTKNTVLVIDGSGNLNLGETSPTIVSTSGTLGIQGQAVLIKTGSGSGGNITLNPDANGIIKLITAGTGTTAGGQLELTNANLATGNLIGGVINNNNRGYNFIQFKNYDVGTTNLSVRFAVDSNGNVNVGGTLTTVNLNIGSTALVANLNADLLDGYHYNNLPYSNYQSWIVNVGTSNNSINSGTTLSYAAGAGLSISMVGNTLTFTNTGVGSTYSFTNGLTNATNVIGLGGTLVQNTQIGTSNFNFSFIGLGGTQGLYQAASGNVGIGTTNPGSSLLNVNGSSNFNGTVSLNSVFMDSSNNWNTVKAIFGGNVGIGTTNPAYKFQVVGDALISTRLGIGATNPLYALNVGGTSGFQDIFALGSLGLGITNPSFKLDIGGSGNLFRLSDSSGNSLVNITDSNAQFNLPTAFTSSGDVSLANDLNFTNSVASNIKSSAPLYLISGETFNSSDLTLRTYNNGNVVIDSQNLSVGGSITAVNLPVGVGTSVLYINSAGVITTGLSVGTTYGATNGISLNVGSTNVFGLGGTLIQNTSLTVGNTNVLFLGINGLVGIGTTNPTKALSVNGDIKLSNNKSVYFQDNSTNDVAVMSYSSGNNLQFDNGSGSMNFSLNNGGNFTYTNNWNETMRLTSTNLVGIGTTNPKYKLEVTGDALISTRLGIGSTNVLYALNVGGTAYFGNLAVGSSAFVTNLNANYLNGYSYNNLPYDNYQNWNLQTNSVGTTAINSLATVNFVNGVGTSLVQSGSTITINSTGTTYAATNGLNLNNGAIGLGGTLTQNTQIGTSNFVLSFLGLGGSQALYITPAGYIGIGTTNPGAKLEITGNGNAAALRITNGYLDIPIGMKLTASTINNDLLFYLPLQGSHASSRGDNGYFTRTDSSSGYVATEFTDSGSIINSYLYTNIPRFEKSYPGRGIWSENSRRNILLYTSFEDGSTVGWSNVGIATTGVSTSYAKHNSYSAALTTTASAGQFFQTFTSAVGGTLAIGGTYPISCYALNIGNTRGTVDSSVVQLYANADIGTSYFPAEGGWYRITGFYIPTVNVGNTIGVDVKANQSIYLDACQVESESNTMAGTTSPYTTTYMYNSGGANQYNRGQENLYYYAWRGSYNVVSTDTIIEANKGTVSFWFKPDWTPSQVNSDLYLFQVPNVIQIFYQASSKAFVSQMWNGTNWTTVATQSAAQSFGANTNHYLAFRWDNTVGTTLNVDGVETAYTGTWTSQAPNITTSTLVYVGSKSTAGGSADALISDVAIFGRSLTSAEVGQIYHNNAPIEDYQRSDLLTLQQNSSSYQQGSINISGNGTFGATVSTANLSSAYVGQNNAANFSLDTILNLPFQNNSIDGSHQEVGYFSRPDLSPGSATAMDDSSLMLVNKNANQPRIDRGLISNNSYYNSGNNIGNEGIYIEDARQNFALDSSFENLGAGGTSSVWKMDVGGTAAITTSKVIHGNAAVDIGSTNATRYYQTVDLSSLAVGTTVDVSVYAYRNESGNWGSSLSSTYLSLYARTDDTFNSLSTTYTPLGNGWYRLTGEFTTTAANNWDIGVYMPSGNRNIIVDAFQAERKADNTSTFYPSTYIPTGVGSTATRAAESLYYNLSSGFKPEKGGFSMWFRPTWTQGITGDTSTKYFIYIPNVVRAYSVGTSIKLDQYNIGTSAWVTTANTTSTNINRYTWNELSCSWYYNYSYCYINGNGFSSSTNWTPNAFAIGTTVPIYIGSDNSGANQINSQVSAFALFDTYLSTNQQYQLYLNHGQFIDYFRTDQARLTDPNSTSTQTGSLYLTGNFRTGLGTVSAPSFSFNSDTDTGMFSPGANTLAFSVGGTQAFTINSNGSVSTASNLTVGGTFVSVGSTNLVTNLNAQYLNGYAYNNLPYFNTASNGLTALTTNNVGLGGSLTQNTTIGTSSFNLSFLGLGGTQGLYQSSTGNVGIGTTNPGYKLEVAGDALISTRLGIGSTNPLYALNVGGTANFANLFTSGSVGIGTTNPKYLLDVAGAGNFTKLGVGGTGTASFNVAANGSIGTNLSVGTSLNVGTNLLVGGTFISVGSTNLVTNLNANYLSGYTYNNLPYQGITTFANGIINVGNTVSLGGSLSIGTSINLNNNNFSLYGAGNFGIGTTSPLYKFTVIGDEFISGHSTIGLGSTNPLYTLNVGGTANFTNLVASNTSIGGTLTLSQGAQNNYVLTSDANGNAKWAFNTAVGTTYSFSNGIIDPGTHIIGLGGSLTQNTTIGTSSFNLSFLGLGGTLGFSQSSNGYVGIGTSNPSSKLDVSGQISATSLFVNVSNLWDATRALFSKVGIGGTSSAQFNVANDATIGTNFTVGGTFVSVGTTDIVTNLNANYLDGYLASNLPLNLQGGAGIGISGTSIGTTIYNTGVLSLTGTTNQIYLSASTGNITLSLPQDIGTSSTPTFNSLNIGSTALITNLNADMIDGKHASDLFYGSWNLQTNGSGTTAIGSTATVNFIGGTGINLVQDGSNITINGAATNFTAQNGLSFLNPTTLGLGGTLTQNTAIGTSSYSLSFLGLGNSQSLYISSSGNVGIGFTSPFTTTTTIGTESNITLNRVISISDTGTSAVSIADVGGTFTTADIGRILLWSDGTPRTIVGVNVSSPSFATIDSNYGLGATQTASLYNPNFYIDKSGNVGVGTANMSTVFQVNGTMSASKYTGLYDNARYFFDPANTTSFNSSLSLHGNGSITFNAQTLNGVPSTILGTASTQLKSFANGFGIATNIGSTGIGSTIVWNEAFYVNNNGNVGIGTSNPQARLHIAAANSVITNTAGDITLNAASGSISLSSNQLINFSRTMAGSGSPFAPAYSFSSSTQTGIYSPNNDMLSIATSGVDRLVVDNTGLINIGAVGTTGSSYGAIQSDIGSSAINLVLNPNGGYIGIGTTSPNKSLEIAGTLRLSTGTSNADIYMAGNNLSIIPNAGGNVGIGTTNPNYKLEVNSGEIASVRNAGDNNSARIGLYQNNVSSNYGQFILASRGIANGQLGFYNQGYGSDVLTLLGTGNVGIGTASPLNTLDIGNSGGIHIASGTPGSTTNALYNNAGGLYWNGAQLATGSVISGTTSYIPKFTGTTTLGNSLIYDNGTNVAVGSASPTERLTIVDAGNSNVYSGTLGVYAQNLTRGIAFGYAGISATGSNPTADLSLNGKSTGNILLQNVGTGNVGIGTASPTALLDVNGFVRSTGLNGSPTSGIGVEMLYQTSLDYGILQAYNRTNSSYKRMDIEGSVISLNANSGNNVGIGTTNPTTKLTIKQAADTGLNSTPLQLQASTNDTALFMGYRDSTAAIIKDALAIMASYTTTGAYKPLAFATSDIERLRIDTAGNIGIGTTTTYAKLTIKDGTNKDLLISGNNYGSANGMAIASVNDTNGAFQDLSLAGSNIILNAGTGGAGYVGIGTTSPGRTLDIQGVNAAVSIKDTTAGGHQYVLTNSVAGNGSLGIYDQTNTAFRMLINSSGYVGIGTTNPAANLDVVGSLGGNAFVVRDSTAGHGGLVVKPQNPFVEIQGTNQQLNAVANISLNPEGGNVGIGTTNPNVKLESVVSDTSTTLGSTYGQFPLIIRNSDNTLNNWRTLGFYGSDANGMGFVASQNKDVTNHYANLALGTRGADGANIRMLIDQSGNVGIGTTNPGSLLQVGSNNTTLTNGTKTAEFQNSIVVGDNNAGGVSFRNAAGTGTLFGMGLDNSNNLYVGLSSPNLYFRTNGNMPMTINSTGNVGIGTSNPGAKLHVVGTGGNNNIFIVGTGVSGEGGVVFKPNFSAGRLSIQGTNSQLTAVADLLINPEGGNVGIGITAPTAKLAVAAATAYGTDSSYAIHAVDASNATKKIMLGYDDTLNAGILASIQSGTAWTNTLINPNGGNVGIGGTPTTANKLAVIGTGGASAGIYMNSAVPSSVSNALYNNAGTLMWNGSAVGVGGTSANVAAGISGFYSKYTSTSTLGQAGMFESNSGLIGIGTTNPLYTFQVVGDQFVSGHSTIGLGSTNPLFALNVGGTANFINLFSSGSIGIGTTAPSSYLLNVNGNANVNGTINLNSIVMDSSNAWNTSRAYFGGNVGIGTTNPTKTLSVAGDIKLGNNKALYFQDNSTNDIGVISYSAGNNLQFDNPSGSMGFSLNNGGNFTYTNNWSETMRLTSTNNVGIGTANPLNKLAVVGTPGGSAGIYLNSAVPSSVSNALYNNGSTLMWNGSAVGVGGTGANVAIGNSGFLSKYTSSNTLGQSLLFEANNGNIGIGTSNPGAKLEVGGDIKLSGQLDLGLYSSAPTTTTAGAMFFNTTTNTQQCYNGTAWYNCGGTLFSNTNATVADGSYITVNHALNTNDLITSAWINSQSTWKALDGTYKPAIAWEGKDTERGVYHNEVNLYAPGTESNDTLKNLLDTGLAFDTFEDTSKIGSSLSSVSIDTQKADDGASNYMTLTNRQQSGRVGLMGGQVLSTGTSDTAGNVYIGSTAVNKIFYYDRSKTDSQPQVQVELGVDPNWYNGVTLTNTNTNGAKQSNPNLSTSYNGSLIKVNGTYGVGSSARSILITITDPATFSWTDNNGNNGSNIPINFGIGQTLGLTGVSATFTNTKYNVGDVFKIASWYVEPFSATRGTKAQFPEKAIAIGTSAGVDIIDSDTQKLWMRFQETAGNFLNLNAPITSVNFLNGKLYVSSAGTVSAFNEADFTADAGYQITNSSTTVGNYGISGRNINTFGYTKVSSPVTIVNTNVNDVSAAVIPNQPTQQVTVTGWGFINATGYTTYGETVNLPYKFNDVPRVTIDYNGYSTSDPKSLADCVSHDGSNVNYKARSITNSNFVAIFDTTATSWAARACYSWTATGTVSPKQFVAVGTGSSSSDGGVSIINETNQTVANVEIGSQTTGNHWFPKVALVNNALYLTQNSDASNLSSILAYYNVAGISSDASWEQQAGAWYGVGRASNLNGPSIVATSGTNKVNSLVVTPGTSTIDGTSNTIYVGTDQGLSVIQEQQSHTGDFSYKGGLESLGSVKYYTNNYISEEMVGDIRGMWPLSGSTPLADASVKADTLTNNGSVTFGTGVRGQAAVFNGSNYLSCTDAACGGTSKLDSGSNKWSVGAWVNPGSVAGNPQIISKFAGSDLGYQLDISGTFRFNVTNTAATWDAVRTSSITPTANTWYYVVGTYDGSSLNIYVNGVLANGTLTGSVPATIRDSAAPFEIGAWGGANGLFTGSIDEPFVTATALTAAQVKNMYQVGYRALQSHATTMGSVIADGNQQLAGTTNTVGVATPDWNNQYVYVGTNSTSQGALSKIQLNSDTIIKKYSAVNNVPNSGSTPVSNDINSIGVGYNLEVLGSATAGAKIMGADDYATATSGSFVSDTYTLPKNIGSAVLWVSPVTDPSDVGNTIAVKASNDGGATYTTCTLNNTTNGPAIPEKEYACTFALSNNNLKVRFDFTRTSTATSTYVTQYGISWLGQTGFKIEQVDANNVRLYNYSGETQNLKLDVTGASPTQANPWTDKGLGYLQTAGYQSLRIYDGTGTSFLGLSHSGTLASLSYNAIPAININASGNVGIGTTNPSQKLDVAGNANISGTLSVIGINTTNVVISNNLTVGGTGTFANLTVGGTANFSNLSVNDISLGSNHLYNTSGTLMWNGLAVGVGGTNTNIAVGISGYFSKYTTTNTLGLSGLFESNSGNIGINNTNPNFKLDVAGTANFTNLLTVGLNATNVALTNLTVGGTANFGNLAATGTIYIGATTTPTDGTNRLYNQGGNLYWNGSAVAVGVTGAAVVNGTPNTLARFTSSNVLGNSLITDNGANVNVNNELTINSGSIQLAGQAIAPGSTTPGTMYYDNNSNNLFLMTGDNNYHRLSLDQTKYSVGGTSVASGSYIEIAHNQNTTDINTAAWFYNTITSQWEDANKQAITILQNLQSQFDNVPVDNKSRTQTALTNISLTQNAYTGNGADGPITVSSSTDINTTSLITGRVCADGGDAVNYSVTALTTNTATVESAPSTGCLNPGDEVLLINLRGTYTNMDNVGNWETLRVAGVNGSTVTFTTAKTKYYGDGTNANDNNIGLATGNQTVMLQRVPNYTNVTVNSGISFYPDAWVQPTGAVNNGAGEGGVMFFRANGTVTVTGTITTSGRGYIGAPSVLGYAASTNGGTGGGGGEAFCGPGGTGGNNNLNNATSGAAGGAVGREQFAGWSGGNGYCGGGGGNEVVGAGLGSATRGGSGGGGKSIAGGGGAGFGTYGYAGISARTAGAGNGGPTSSGNGAYSNATYTYGAGGGGGTYGDQNLNQLFLGSAGGAGSAYDNGAWSGAGGNGGGIVYIASNTVNVSGSIQSSANNGGAGQCPASKYSGGGGGGAGGSIKIVGNVVNLGASVVMSVGGSGNNGCENGTAGMANGGGNGGAGRIAVQYITAISGSAVPAAVTTLSGYNTYGTYTSSVIATPNAANLGNLKWDATLNTYGKISFQTRTGNTPDPSGNMWYKLDNSIPQTMDSGTAPSVGNGRLGLGSSGKGDSVLIDRPSVINDNGTYKMWYSGYDGTAWRIYYATSVDGLTWTKANNNAPGLCDSTGPCSYSDGRLGLGSAGKGDSVYIDYPAVIKDGSTYRMWYSGYDGTNWRIYAATSSDGLTWTKTDNSIPAASNTTSSTGRIPLGIGTTTGDTTYAYFPSVIKDGSTYKMWYAGRDNANVRIYAATSPDAVNWTKVSNLTPSTSDITGTNGQIPLGNSGRGDSTLAFSPSVIKDGSIYKMWYSGNDGTNNRTYTAFSSDGLTWTKTDNTIPNPSDTVGTNGRLPISSFTAKLDSLHAYQPTVIRDGSLYRMWYIGNDGTSSRVGYAYQYPDNSSWESWKPYTAGTNQTMLDSGNNYLNWTGTNTVVAAGDVTRNVYNFEDENESNPANITKLTASTSGSSAGDTFPATDLSTYDYVTFWIRSSQPGNTITVGLGQSSPTEQTQNVTIDTANVWQKVYWDLSAIPAAQRVGITKFQITNTIAATATIYVENIKAERLINTSNTSIASTPQNYLQYRAIFTTTNTSYMPQLNNVTFTYNNGYKIVQTDANHVRLYNFTGSSQNIKLEATVYGADLAEWYTVDDSTIESGDVVAITGNKDDYNVPIVTKANVPGDKHLMGIISTNAGQELGIQADNRRLVALSGRVPVKIAPDSQSITPGDLLTASKTYPGMATKATTAGFTVAKALDSWAPGSQVSLLDVFINISWFDPDVHSNDDGQITIDHNIDASVLASLGYSDSLNELQSQNYNLVDALGHQITTTGQFASATVGKLEAGLIQASTIVTKNLVAETTKTKTLSTAVITPLSDITDTVTIAGNASVSGTLTAQSIGASEASFSNIYADQINTKDGSITDVMAAKINDLRTELQKSIASVTKPASSSADITGSALMAQSSDWETTPTTASAQIDPGTLLTDNLVVGSQLTVNGNTTLGNAFITGTFTTGEIAIKDNFIETVNSALYIQPSDTGSVHLMGDTLVIAENGEVVVNGNLQVTGKFTANMLVASDIQSSTADIIDLTTTKLHIATESAEASSSGTIIADPSFANLATSSAKMTSNATAGSATLPAGKTELIINNKNLGPNSIIYLTPAGSTGNQVVYLKSKFITPTPSPVATESALPAEASAAAGKPLDSFFTIAIDQPLHQDININWWIIN